MDEQAKNPHQWPGSAPDLASRRRAFGARLKAAREEKGLTAQALSQLTRINQHYIEALEDGALDRLPGAVFGRGFVRCITKNIKIEGDDHLNEFNACWNEAAPTSVLKVEIKSKPPKRNAEAVAKAISTVQSLVRRGVIFKIAVPVAAVAAGVFVIKQGSVHLPHLPDFSKYLHLGTASVSTPDLAKSPAKELDLTPPKSAEHPVAASEPVAAQPEVAKAEEAAPVAPPAKPEAVTAPVPEQPAGATTAVNEQVLELTVIEPVRIRLDVDKGRPVTKELTPDTYRFSFNDKADLLIYDAAALKISFNGKQLGSLGTKGRVRRLSFQAAAPESGKNR